MIPRHTLYRSRGCAGYKLVMSSTTAGGGDEIRYKYIVLVRFGVGAVRVSHMDSAATEAELDGWGAVVDDRADKAEILHCVTCRQDGCTRITTRARCTSCHAEQGPKRGRYRNCPSGRRGR